jgi:membrane protein involved in colicin uptake
MHLVGIVSIHIVIQPDGMVSDTRIESGHALLASAAQIAVSKWRYSPSTDVSETTVDIAFTYDAH